MHPSSHTVCTQVVCLLSLSLSLSYSLSHARNYIGQWLPVSVSLFFLSVLSLCLSLLPLLFSHLGVAFNPPAVVVGKRAERKVVEIELAQKGLGLRVELQGGSFSPRAPRVPVASHGEDATERVVAVGGGERGF